MMGSGFCNRLERRSKDEMDLGLTLRTLLMLTVKIRVNVLSLMDHILSTAMVLMRKSFAFDTYCTEMNNYLFYRSSFSPQMVIWIWQQPHREQRATPSPFTIKHFGLRVAFLLPFKKP